MSFIELPIRKRSVIIESALLCELPRAALRTYEPTSLRMLLSLPELNQRVGTVATALMDPRHDAWQVALLLSARGYRGHIAAYSPRLPNAPMVCRELCAAFPNITFEVCELEADLKQNAEPALM